MSKWIETAVPVDASRHLPLSLFGEKLKLLHASGAVDYVHVWDQLMGWWPRHLWTPENSPLARFVPDIDSQPEAFTTGAYALATAPDMGLSISTDAIRRGPTEVLQALLTLENIATRPPVLQLGAGELRNIKPYGYKRSEGLKRLEDHLRFYHAFRTTDGPIDLVGNIWKYEQAWIGRGGNADNLRVWGLGGGPKLLDITTSYADGIASITPAVWTRPEHTAERVTAIKQMLEDKGRDPEAFDFALWGAVLIHEDQEVIEGALHNPIVRWLEAIVGRFNQADWLEEGFQPPLGADWHYGTKFLPLRYDTDHAAAQRILDHMSPDLVRRALICGTPEQVAEQLQAHVEAGVNWVEVADMMPFVLEPEQAAAAVARSIRVCQILKGDRARADAKATAGKAG
jgi:phthiodiolone/phenolphthiodiolone dimycocerosates ketoreductase